MYPPDHPLGSACLKIKRAKVHINGLDRSIRRTFNTDAAFQPPNADGQSSSSYRLSVEAILPDTWGPIIGDIVANLRNALDHIAWALAVKQFEATGVHMTENEARRIAFPLYFSDSAYQSASGRALEKIWPPAHATIEKFQPYHTPDWPDVELLGILHDLSNRDKHRVVTPTVQGVGISLGSPDTGFTSYLDKGDKMLFVVNSKPQATLGVFFRAKIWGGGVETFGVLRFHDIHDFIRDEVVPAFAGFFE